VGKFSNLATVIIVALLVPLVPFLVVGELPGERWLSQADDNALAFALTGSGLLALDIALPVPSSLVGTALGARLGFWAGLLCCWLGLMAGNVVGYVSGHLFPHRLATPLAAEPMDAILFLSRPVPVIAEAAVIAAGATRVPLVSFLVSCALGNGVYSLALCTNATLWLAGDLRGPILVLPMLLPVAAWFAWRRLGPQLRIDD